MKENPETANRQPFVESYLATTGFPSPKGFNSNLAYLKAVEKWVRKATTTLAELNDHKNLLGNCGGS